MSLASACLWTLARTLVICLIAWPVCAAVERWLRGLSDRQRGWALGGLLAPFCFPELLVGYALRDIAMAHPRWAEALCSGLLFVRVVPVGAVALLMAPLGELDATAMYCRRLLVRARRDSAREWLELTRCYWHGPIQRALPALGLMGIVAFQEFELAALLMTTSWTDWFVAAERVGLNRGEMLRQTSWPLLLQLPVLLAIVWWLRGAAVRRRGETSSDAEVVATGRSNRVTYWFAAGYVAIAFVVGCLVPLSLIGWRTVDGLVRGVILLLPGLLGSLLLSLGMVALFQVSWLRPLYDTPLPWVLALTLWLLPRAAVLQLWLDAMRPSEAVHLAEMLSAPQPSALIWRLRDQPQFLAMSLLCYWAYCDLPTAYLLAPTGMAAGLVRLYNFMHFGRSAALSAEACLFFIAPLGGVACVLFAIRWWRG